MTGRNTPAGCSPCGAGARRRFTARMWCQAENCVRQLAFAAVSGCCRSTFPAFAEALLGDDQKDLFANDW